MIFFKKIAWYVFLILAVILTIIIFFWYSLYSNESDRCTELTLLSDNDYKVEQVRDAVLSSQRTKKVIANYFMDSELDSIEFNKLGVDWKIIGLETRPIAVRLNLYSPKDEKIIENVDSISILLGRCCLLKIPMNELKALNLTEDEKKYQILGRKNVYMSCNYEHIHKKKGDEG